MLGGRGTTEFLIAIEVATGKELWSAAIGPLFTFKGNSWGDGPRATPTIDGDRVFALGGQGELLCTATADGHELWRTSLARDLHGEISPAGGGPPKIGWGFTESPVVDGDRLICTPGGDEGMLAALDKSTGKVLWRSKDLKDAATYASIVPAEIDGVRQYVQMSDRGVLGVSTDGKLLWRYVRRPAYSDVVIPTCVVQKDLIYTTVGYGAGCDLVRVTRGGEEFQATKVYANKNMVNQHGGVVLLDERLFGYSEGKGWVCQDLKTGKIIWNEKRKLGRGSLTAAEGHLYCYAEDDGTTVLVKAGAEPWQESGRFTIPEQSSLHKPNGKVWTHPVIANARLYLRDQELLFSYDIKDRTGAR
jgi:outer membrane protein assembly factor BamB